MREEGREPFTTFPPSTPPKLTSVPTGDEEPVVYTPDTAPVVRDVSDYSTTGVALVTYRKHLPSKDVPASPERKTKPKRARKAPKNAVISSGKVAFTPKQETPSPYGDSLSWQDRQATHMT